MIKNLAILLDEIILTYNLWIFQIWGLQMTMKNWNVYQLRKLHFGSHSVFPPKIWRDFILKTPYTGGRGWKNVYSKEDNFNWGVRVIFFIIEEGGGNLGEGFLTLLVFDLKLRKKDLLQN